MSSLSYILISPDPNSENAFPVTLFDDGTIICPYTYRRVPLNTIAGYVFPINLYGPYSTTEYFEQLTIPEEAV